MGSLANLVRNKQRTAAEAQAATTRPPATEASARASARQAAGVGNRTSPDPASAAATTGGGRAPAESSARDLAREALGAPKTKADDDKYRLAEDAQGDLNVRAQALGEGVGADEVERRRREAAERRRLAREEAARRAEQERQSQLS